MDNYEEQLKRLQKELQVQFELLKNLMKIRKVEDTIKTRKNINDSLIKVSNLCFEVRQTVLNNMDKAGEAGVVLEIKILIDSIETALIYYKWYQNRKN